MSYEEGTTEQATIEQQEPERAKAVPESGSILQHPEWAKPGDDKHVERIDVVYSEEEDQHVIAQEGITPIGAPVPGPELRRNKKRAMGRGVLAGVVLPGDLKDITNQLTLGMQQLVGAVLAGAKREAERKYPKPMSRLRKPNGEIDWEKVHRVDENMLKRGMPLDPKRSKCHSKRARYMSIIRLILRLPRDGWWYKITPKKHMTTVQLRQARAALGHWLKRLEYDTILRLHHDSGGLYACWHPEPGKENVPKLNEEQLRTKVQLRKIEEFAEE